MLKVIILFLPCFSVGGFWFCLASEPWLVLQVWHGFLVWFACLSSGLHLGPGVSLGSLSFVCQFPFSGHWIVFACVSVCLFFLASPACTPFPLLGGCPWGFWMLWGSLIESVVLPRPFPAVFVPGVWGFSLTVCDRGLAGGVPGF